jgi:hypothetical protein
MRRGRRRGRGEESWIRMRITSYLFPLFLPSLLLPYSFSVSSSQSGQTTTRMPTITVAPHTTAVNIANVSSAQVPGVAPPAPVVAPIPHAPALGTIGLGAPPGVRGRPILGGCGRCLVCLTPPRACKTCTGCRGSQTCIQRQCLNVI